jgi:hypothetical protein
MGYLCIEAGHRILVLCSKVADVCFQTADICPKLWDFYPKAWDRTGPMFLQASVFVLSNFAAYISDFFYQYPTRQSTIVAGCRLRKGDGKSGCTGRVSSTFIKRNAVAYIEQTLFFK